MALATAVSTLSGLAPAGATVVPTASVTGAVTAAGVPVGNLVVAVFGTTYGNLLGSATTDGNGGYTVNVTGPAYVKVRVDDAAHVYATRFNGNADTWAAAPVLVVPSSGVATANVAVLSYKGSIAGTVTDGAAAPVAGASVAVKNAVYGNTVATVSTDADGHYQADLLNPGNYKLRFTAPGVGGTVLYNGNTIAWPDAPLVVVASHTTTVADEVLPNSATISGLIRAGGVARPGVYALALRSTQPAEVIASAQSDANGLYVIRGLAPGSYKVAFIDPTALAVPGTGMRPVMYPTLDLLDLTVAGAMDVAPDVTVPAAVSVDASLVGMQCSAAFLTSGNLHGADLTGCDLSNRYLSFRDLSNATLVGAHFGNNAMSFVNLAGVNAAGATFGAGVRLAYANVSGANLRNAVLNGLTISDTNFALSDLRGAQLRQTSLQGGTAANPSTSMTGVNLSGADLSGAVIANGYFGNANLDGVILDGAHFDYVNLSGALRAPAPGAAVAPYFTNSTCPDATNYSVYFDHTCDGHYLIAAPVLTGMLPPDHVALGNYFSGKVGFTGATVYWGNGLPDWMSIDAQSGALIGIPTAMGTYGPYSVTAWNPLGSTTSQLLFVEVGERPVFTNPTTTFYVEAGQAVSIPFPATGAGTITYGGWNLPWWLTVDPTTGDITSSAAPGLGTSSGTFWVTATNAFGMTYSPTLSVVVGAVPWFPEWQSSFQAYAGQPFGVWVTAYGSPGDATFSSPDVPSWLTLDSNGYLHADWIPAAGTEGGTFTIVATNAVGSTALTVTVNIA